MTRRSLVPIGFVVVLAIVSVILSGPLNRLEDQLLDGRYGLRGELSADTNVVILYFDNDDIASLGGWPLKRNYYALLIDVLTKSDVAAIGLDIFFGERNLEYPEHDDLLASKVANSSRVVVSSYFRQTGLGHTALVNPPLPEKYYVMSQAIGLYGNHLQLPFQELVQTASGLGHTNLMDGSEDEVPLFIRVDNQRAVPAFFVELLRVFYRFRREDVNMSKSNLTFTSEGGGFEIPIGADGIARLNLPGSISSFKRYRCVEVMRSFQLRKLGIATPVDLSSFKNKIVLIGVIGEGRSTFVSTPFDPQFPLIGIHATALDNAIRQRFLVKFGNMVTGIISLLFVSLIIILIKRKGYPRGIGLGIALLAVYAGVSQILFSTANLILPLVQPVLLSIAVFIGTVGYEFLIVRRKLGQLESEKEHIESELRERELKLQMLEQELLDEKSKEQPSRGTELLEEIRRYKQDIKNLSAQVSDLVKFEPPTVEQSAERAAFEGIIYQSSGKMKEVVDLIQKIAASDANVLILGESGTGKELVAKAIHNLSGRKEKRFVAVNCGALTETLLESELFGHEKGSFTGAVRDNVGRFEVADGGTIFLDEIAETSEAFQVKVLRVVQHGELERVGSNETRNVDTRIVAATNKNVKELIQKKRFREDLYYRLNVFTVQLPALRERKGDITILAEFFVGREDGSLAISSTVMDAFLQYQWPGNVRELESAITRAAILAKSEKRSLIQTRDLPPEVAASIKNQIDLEDQILELLRAKKFSRSSISETAEELGGLNRGTVAEYFRGICFKFFFENIWDKEKTALSLSDSADAEMNERVQKKLDEYLGNVVASIEAGQPFDESKQSLKPKYKNLPQRYHTILDEVVRAYLLAKWQ